LRILPDADVLEIASDRQGGDAVQQRPDRSGDLARVAGGQQARVLASDDHVE
jgi:hypothetical protein